MTAGKPIAAGQVLSKSVGMIAANPGLLLPQVIALIPGLLGILILGTPSPLNGLAIITAIASFVVAVIVSGAYPFMVKAVVDGGRISMAEAMGKAYHRFWTLLGAGLLVALVVGLGFVAIVVPGIILLTWYAYTVPAIMLEDKGALAGMAASKAFGRDKKWSTFVMFVAVLLVSLVVLAVETLLTLGGGRLVGQVVGEILFVPIGAWVSVLLSYTYISHGPSSVAGTAGTAAYGMAPLASTPQPSMQAGTSGLFCASCGSPVEPGSKFCRNCGKAV